jgi:hypothetical protein
MNKIFHLLFAILFILLFSCRDNDESSKESTTDELKDSSAYLTKVFDFQYAPGQNAQNADLTNAQNFVGKPTYLYTVTPEETKSCISLGGWGGYIVGGFNHNIANTSGNDFIVLCGSSYAPEPAIVYVMEDTNGNGLPDDNWYELKGSENSNQESIRGYQVTYYKPSSTSGNVYWKDNQGHTDTLISNYGATYTYSWWKYTDKDSLTFTGTKLPTAYYNNSTTSTQNWVVYSNLFHWGYAENATGSDYNSTYHGNEFDISNAIDANGNPVSLSSIRFIKVQTGVFQQAGWLNEISSEIYGAADLSLLK